MGTFAGIGVVVLAEITAVLAAVVWRRYRRLKAAAADPVTVTARSADGTSLTAVLEIEDVEALLPTDSRKLPLRILTELREDPTLGLADVRIVQHVQPTGAGLPERSQVGQSYQGLNESVAKAAVPSLDESDLTPVPAARLTWMALRLDVPGSHNVDCVERSAEPITARGGGWLGATRTLDKAVRTASAKLTAADFATTKLTEDDLRQTLATSRQAPANADVATASGGVLVGVDPSHRPVVLGLFRRRPVAVSLIAGLHLAQLLVLRAAAVGARVIVETARHELWDPLVLHSGLDGSRLAVQPVGRVVGNPGWSVPSPTAPVFVLRDCGARPPFASTPHGPWATVTTLLPFLDARTAGQLAMADLVGLQRMPPEEVGFAQPTLDLPAKDVAALPELPDGMAVWRVRGRTSRYTEIVPTAWETGILGDPIR